MSVEGFVGSFGGRVASEVGSTLELEVMHCY